MTASGDDRAVAAPLEGAQPLRDLGRVALRRSPRVELQIEPFGELRQLELDAPGDGVAELVEGPGGGPGQRVGERFRLFVGRGCAVQRASRLSEDDPRSLGQEL